MNQTLAYTVIQGVVSVALLLFAYLVRGDTHVTDVVIGAVVATWLREGVYLGQALGQKTLSPPAGPAGTTAGPAETTHVG